MQLYAIVRITILQCTRISIYIQFEWLNIQCNSSFMAPQRYEVFSDRPETQFDLIYSFRFDFIFSTKFARVIVKFKDDQIVSTKVSASKSFTEFIAIAGSLICLLMGASFLSILELLYYFTVCMFNVHCIPKRSTNWINRSSSNTSTWLRMYFHIFVMNFISFGCILFNTTASNGKSVR